MQHHDPVVASFGVCFSFSLSYRLSAMIHLSSLLGGHRLPPFACVVCVSVLILSAHLNVVSSSASRNGAKLDHPRINTQLLHHPKLLAEAGLPEPISLQHSGCLRCLCLLFAYLTQFLRAMFVWKLTIVAAT